MKIKKVYELDGSSEGLEEYEWIADVLLDSFWKRVDYGMSELIPHYSSGNFRDGNGILDGFCLKIDMYFINLNKLDFIKSISEYLEFVKENDGEFRFYLSEYKSSPGQEVISLETTFFFNKMDKLNVFLDANKYNL